MTIAYIAHPISGDVDGNLAIILEIIRDINLNEPDVVPVAPYLGDVLAMDDNTPTERARGLKNGLELIKRGVFDELRLYGDEITDGMHGEITKAIKHGVTVRPMTFGTQDDYFTFYQCNSNKR